MKKKNNSCNKYNSTSNFNNIIYSNESNECRNIW